MSSQWLQLSLVDKTKLSPWRTQFPQIWHKSSSPPCKFREYSRLLIQGLLNMGNLTKLCISRCHQNPPPPPLQTNNNNNNKKCIATITLVHCKIKSPRESPKPWRGEIQDPVLDHHQIKSISYQLSEPFSFIPNATECEQNKVAVHHHLHIVTNLNKNETCN